MIKSLPQSPGIYLFRNKYNVIIYIGKAKNLQKRVRSYFQKNHSDVKTNALLQEYSTIEYIVTQSDTQALLLEAEYIKRYHPKYNILLKEGQPYLYLAIIENPLPELKLTRIKKDSGNYFGPFIHKSQARSIYNFLLNTFKLRLCKKKITNGCLDFHLGTCAGNCLNKFDHEDYIFRLQLAHNALKRNHKEFLKQLKLKIKEHIKQLDFEKAQHLTVYLNQWKTIFSTIKDTFDPKKFVADVNALTASLTKAIDTENISVKLQQYFVTEKPIVTIDCFDISHFQSQHIVGSCIRFTNGIPEKNKFRRFAIKSLREQNDYAALQEVVQRRYKDNKDIPDLIVIDGGKGQLHAVKKIVTSKNIVSLAKKEERLYSMNHPNGIIIKINDPVGKLLIELRDYAHHFAVQYHRSKKRKTELKN